MNYPKLVFLTFCLAYTTLRIAQHCTGGPPLWSMPSTLSPL